MSNMTIADEKLQKAIDYLYAAYKEMLVVLHPDTPGYNEFTSGTIDKFHDVAKEIIQLKRKLY